MMRAVLVRKFGGVENMKLENDVAVPVVGDKQVSYYTIYCIFCDFYKTAYKYSSYHIPAVVLMLYSYRLCLLVNGSWL